MKKLFTLLTVAALAATLTGCKSLTASHTPKKLLVVTTTTGFRHSSIPTLEKVLTQLGQTSGEFTVDFVQQPPGHPNGFTPALKADASDDAKAMEAAWQTSL